MEKEEEIKELKSRLSLIEEFYEENNLIKRIKFYIKYYKEKKKNANYTNNRDNDKARNNSICNNRNDNISNNDNNKIFNNKKIEKLELESGKIDNKEFLAKYITHNRYKINELINEINNLKEK